MTPATLKIMQLMPFQQLNYVINILKKNLFNAFSKETLDNTFLSYQNAMESSMNIGGSNQYKLKHMGKENLRREGRLPVSILCNPESILEARKSIDIVENNV